MKSAESFYVFQKWENAPSFAFGNRGSSGIVPPADRDAYWSIYSELAESAETALADYPRAGKLILRPKAYSKDRGSRGHRPKDLWFSICSAGAHVLGYMPQVYAIASQRGLEIGFAASISEDDYFDANVKERNRAIVPFINSKLPDAQDALTTDLDASLKEQGAWHLNLKTRLIATSPGFDHFSSLAKLLDYLKRDGDATGAGVVCRQFSIGELSALDLAKQFSLALSNFGPLLEKCAPTKWDSEVRQVQDQVQDLAGNVAPFDPENTAEGKLRVLAEVARRQGQARFRRCLLEAYGGICAITGVNVPDVLQAAHISPYDGPSTNHTTNGLLLRADLHTLFDIGLITVNPNSMTISVSQRLEGTPYWQFNGQPIRRPARPVDWPSTAALAGHFKQAMGDDAD